MPVGLQLPQALRVKKRRPGKTLDVQLGRNAQSIVKMMLSKNGEKEQIRQDVGEFLLEHAGKTGRIATLPGAWRFEELFWSKTSWSFVCAEHSKTVMANFASQMPGPSAQAWGLDVGSELVHGYANNRIRILNLRFDLLATMDLWGPKSLRQYLRQRYLDWDGVWLDMCSCLGNESLKAIRSIRNGMGSGTKPVCITIQASREHGDISDLMNEFDRSERDDIRIAVVKEMIGRGFKTISVSRYISRSTTVSGQSAMLVVKGLLTK